MKSFFYFVAIFNLSSLANGMDFSGKWKGTCARNGTETNQEIKIQTDANSITIEDDIFSLTSTTVRNNSGVEDDQDWKEVTVYDWKWNDDKTMISTNSRWLGWYVNQNGAWSGHGAGYIKMNGAQLETKRAFQTEFNDTAEQFEELCKYDLNATKSL